MKTKRWNKFIVSLLAASLMATTPVLANGSAVQQEQTQEISSEMKQELSAQAKLSLDKLNQLVPELKNLEVKFQNLMPANEWSPAVWSIQMDNLPENGRPDAGINFSHAYIELLADSGELRSFSMNVPSWASKKAPTESLARKKAQEFVEGVWSKERLAKYQQSSQFYMGQHGSADENGNKLEWTTGGVQYERLINGIPYLGENITIDIDQAGHVHNFYSNIQGNLDESKFPAPSKAISKADAEKAFREKLNMELVYSGQQPVGKWAMEPNQKMETRTVLKYEPTWVAQIDAVTGKATDTYYTPPKKQTVNMQAGGQKLKVQSLEDAKKFFKNTFGVDLSNLQVEQSNEDDHPYGDYSVVNYHFHPDYSVPQEQPMRYATITVNKKTGEIVYAYIQDEARMGKKAVISEEEAIKKGVDFLQTYVHPDVKEADLQVFAPHKMEENIPAWVDKSKLGEQRMDPAPEYHLTMREYHNGIPVEDRFYSVTVDAVSGKISGVGLPLNAKRVELPEAKNVITPEQAADAYLKKFPLKLAYIWEDYMGQKAPKPQLIYMPTYPDGAYYIDAFTGKVED